MVLVNVLLIGIMVYCCWRASELSDIRRYKDGKMGGKK